MVNHAKWDCSIWILFWNSRSSISLSTRFPSLRRGFYRLKHHHRQEINLSIAPRDKLCPPTRRVIPPPSRRFDFAPWIGRSDPRTPLTANCRTFKGTPEINKKRPGKVLSKKPLKLKEFWLKNEFHIFQIVKSHLPAVVVYPSPGRCLSLLILWIKAWTLFCIRLRILRISQAPCPPR